MSKYKSYIDPNHCYFVTTSLINRGFKFLQQDCYAAVILDSLNFLRQNQKLYVFAFVVMPNHLHILIKPRSPHNVSQIMHSFKRFTSGEIKKTLKGENYNVWRQFQNFGGALWQEGFLDENIYSEKLFLEKVEYIHNNPVAKNWRLVDNRADYRYSSACYYDRSEKPIIEIDDFCRVLM
ncbi:MAG: transposase [Deltaproteobacteria bacterium]|nr:transposase [Deltaproteobacteria bacterium]